MNAVLRMLAEADQDCVDHLIREWTNQVRELASDSEDCVDTYKQRVRHPLPRPPVDPGAPLNTARILLGQARLLPSTVRLQFVKLFLKRSLAADLQALLARMVIISERRARYGVDREALRRSACFAAVSPATLSAQALRPANDPQHFIGMTDQVDTLAGKLRSGDDKDVKVFSIVGFGGLGKTTLAMEVCRELAVDFPHQAQVSVSQAFDAGKDLVGLLKRMLHQMVKPKSNNSDGIKEEEDVDIDNIKEEKLTTMLKRLLRDKRYLIVIDDVWTIPAWDAIRSKLHDGNEHNSRIIVTTRVESVAKACSSVCAKSGDRYFVHHMKPLGKKESEQLFIKRVFAPEYICPSDLEGSMYNILRKCGGLPLAIVSMASVLASYKSPGSKEMWDKICNSIGSQLEINPTLEGMRQIVTLSYSHLPHHLKTCMMYFSIYPEDYEIKKKWLLRKWVAEGLVAEKRGLTSLEVAESYFDELLSRNMIVPASISFTGRVKSCRVHDMMLEVMVSRSMEANFVSLVGGEQCEGESHGKIRRLSIQGSGGPKDERSMKHVRSLSTFHPQGHETRLERLREFTLLRVLDLEDCKAVQNKHMKHVCRMFLLRFLNLNGTDISKMPKKIGKLVHLQTLSLRKTLLNGLPQSVTELEKLEFLHFCTRRSPGWRPPCGLGRMKALRVLDRVMLYDDGAEAAREFGELTQLKKLNICIDCSQEVLQVLVTALNRTYSLRQFSIFDLGHGKIMNILGEMTSPPLLLRSMNINAGIDGMPKWFGSLMHLVKLDISWTELSSDKILGILCELPNLVRLTLGRMSYTNDALVISAKYRFPVLKQLSVDACNHPEHKEIIFEQGSMAMLEKLEVAFGSREMSLSGIEHLQSLKKVVLSGRRSNDTLNQTVLQLKSESDLRPVPSQFKVVARYLRERRGDN